MHGLLMSEKTSHCSVLGNSHAGGIFVDFTENSCPQIFIGEFMLEKSNGRGWGPGAARMQNAEAEVFKL